MSVWTLGDSSRAVSAQSRELLNSWNSSEESLDESSAPQSWASQNGLLALSDMQRTNPLATLPNMSLDVTTVAPELKSAEATQPLRLELPVGRVEKEAAFARYAPIKDTSVSPLARVNQTLEENSESSRWLNQRGYLEAFKSPNCVLDISFSTDKNLLKVGAVLSAPDGSKRTIVACDDGTSFQRISGPGGQEIVKFLSNGQIVEFGDTKKSGETRRLLARTGENARVTRSGELNFFK